MLKSIAALSAVLLLAACGEDTQTAAKSLRSEIVAHSAMAAAGSLTEAEADCLASGMVERLGVDRLRDYEILTADLKVNQGIDDVALSAADAGALADVFLGCLDVRALLRDRLTAGSTAAAASVAQQECVAEAVTEETVRRILVAGFEGRKSEAYASLKEHVTGCAVDAG